MLIGHDETNFLNDTPYILFISLPFSSFSNQFRIAGMSKIFFEKVFSGSIHRWRCCSKENTFSYLNVSYSSMDKTFFFTFRRYKIILLNINPLQNMNIGEIVSLNYNTLNWKEEKRRKTEYENEWKFPIYMRREKNGNWSELT